jgi:PAS domain S-box-containing protein
MARFSGEKIRQRVLLFLSIPVVCVGLWAARESGQHTDLRMRRELAREARSIAAMIPLDEIRALSFSAEDAVRPEFQRLCSQLRAYAEATGLRSVYTMALRDGKLVFGPESLSPDDPYASPPGTVYEDPSEQDFEIFKTGKAIIQGPASDEDGSFITASIPVTDPRTGKVRITVGLDIETSVWRAEIRKAQWMSFLTTLAPLAVLLAGYLILKRRQWLAPEEHKHLRHTEAATCAGIMLVLTLAAALLAHKAERESREETFYELALTKADIYIDAVKDLHSSLNMLVRFFESCETVTRDEFSSYCKPLVENNPIQVCIWVPAISAADAPDFITQVRAKEQPGFSIWQLDEKKLPVPAQGDLFYPVLYVEPQAGHETALGYNTYSEPLRRTAIAETLQTGLATATDPITLIALPDNPPGWFIFKPAAIKQQNGVVGFAVRPEMLITGLDRNSFKETSELSITLFQLSVGAPPLQLACSMKPSHQDCWNLLQAGVHLRVPVFAYGKAYSLVITPEANWLKANPLRQGRMALIIGLALTVLLTTLIGILASRPAVLGKLVNQRTAELQENQARLRTLVETIPDLIWLKDTSGVYLSCNTAFERLYGAKEAEITGKTDYDFVDQEQADFSRIHDRKAMAQDRPTINEEWRTFADGGYRGFFETIKTPLRDADGNLIGVLGIARDITARKNAEQQINAQLEELTRWHQATMGRETRVIELKKEVNALLHRIGEPPKYQETV